MFDIAVASLMLAVTAPLWVLIAIAIKLESQGPVFFRQTRVGRGGRLFKMFKFRKMPENLPTQGPLLTRRSDPRLTRVGGWLERTKFDELPQLLNVLRGEMSLIGPRPEVTKFVDLDDRRWQVVLSARPGLFGINQIMSRNESSLYPDDCPNLEGFYVEHILPDKLERDGTYVRQAGLLYDLQLLVRGVMVSVFGTVTGSSIRAHGPQAVMLALDLVLSVVGLAFSYYVIGGGHLRLAEIPHLAFVATLYALSRCVAFLTLGIYRRRPLSLTCTDLIRIIKSVLYGTSLFLALSSLIPTGVPRSVLLLDALTLTAVLIVKAYGLHQTLRSYTNRLRRWSPSRVVGAVGIGTALNATLFYGVLRVFPAGPLGEAHHARLVAVFSMFVAVRAYGMFRYGLDRPERGWKMLLDAPGIARDTAVGSVAVFVTDTVFYSHMITPLVLIVDLALSSAIVMALRHGLWNVGSAARVTDAVSAPQRAVLVGIGPETEFYLSYLENVPAPGPRILGVLDSGPGVPRHQTINHVPVIGSFAQLGALIEAQSPDEVIYFPSAVSEAQKQQLEAVCSRHDTALVSFPDLLDLASIQRTARVAVTKRGGLVTANGTP